MTTTATRAQGTQTIWSLLRTRVVRLLGPEARRVLLEESTLWASVWTGMPAQPSASARTERGRRPMSETIRTLAKEREAELERGLPQARAEVSN